MAPSLHEKFRGGALRDHTLLPTKETRPERANLSNCDPQPPPPTHTHTPAILLKSAVLIRR